MVPEMNVLLLFHDYTRNLLVIKFSNLNVFLIKTEISVKSIYHGKKGQPFLCNQPLRERQQRSKQIIATVSGNKVDNMHQGRRIIFSIEGALKIGHGPIRVWSLEFMLVLLRSR